MVRKTKKFFKTIGRGAVEIGTRVRAGTGDLIKKAKEVTSVEAQEQRLIKQEKKLIVQERLAKRRARIAKLQQKAGGGSFGLPGLDTFTQEPTKKKNKGKPFDPFSQF